MHIWKSILLKDEIVIFFHLLIKISAKYSFLQKKWLTCLVNNIEPSMPRFAEVVPQWLIPEAYYWVNVAISFVNHILELDKKFPDLVSFSTNILRIVPSVLCSVKFNVNVKQLKNKYAKDLPSCSSLRKNKFSLEKLI